MHQVEGEHLGLGLPLARSGSFIGPLKISEVGTPFYLVPSEGLAIYAVEPSTLELRPLWKHMNNTKAIEGLVIFWGDDYWLSKTLKSYETYYLYRGRRSQGDSGVAAGDKENPGEIGEVLKAHRDSKLGFGYSHGDPNNPNSDPNSSDSLTPEEKRWKEIFATDDRIIANLDKANRNLKIATLFLLLSIIMLILAIVKGPR